ncbi:MAG: hypothetical protein KF850_41020 [Labilithrix sp.]|nr:hypothetical protein [Labilithrix sp.]MBX3218460.1 hypothetical protein [Labilithrix sp.]
MNLFDVFPQPRMQGSWGEETTCAYIRAMTEGGLRRVPLAARKVLGAKASGAPSEESASLAAGAESKKGSLELEES